MNPHATNTRSAKSGLRPPADDLERRRPVWAAMSEFFLDTQLDAADHQRIAWILAASGYSAAQLDYILWRELCPVLCGNTASVAGEWAGFDMESVERQILQEPAGRIRSWWSRVSGGGIARSPWMKVRELLKAAQVPD